MAQRHNARNWPPPIRDFHCFARFDPFDHGASVLL